MNSYINESYKGHNHYKVTNSSKSNSSKSKSNSSKSKSNASNSYSDSNNSYSRPYSESNSR